MEKRVKIWPRPQYAGGNWKRRFHSENASNFFRPHYVGGIEKRNNHQPTYVCVWKKEKILGREITWSSWGYRFKELSVCKKTDENAKAAFSNSSGLMSIFVKLGLLNVFKLFRWSVDGVYTSNLLIPHGLIGNQEEVIHIFENEINENRPSLLLYSCLFFPLGLKICWKVVCYCTDI